MVDADAAVTGAVETAVVDADRDFDEFYRTHRDDLCRMLALAVGDPNLGFEAADEAMARAFRDWSTVARLDRPMGWAYRVGLNWGRSRLRRRSTRRRKAHLVAVDDRHLDRPRDPELADALATLDTDRRAIIVLRFYADWSVDEIAAALELPAGTVKSRLHRALAELERLLATDEEARS